MWRALELGLNDGKEPKDFGMACSPLAKRRGLCVLSLLSPNNGWRYVPGYDGCQENTLTVVAVTSRKRALMLQLLSGE